jgi:site-specific recombinase XerD
MIDGYLASLRRRNFSVETRLGYGYCLRRFESDCGTRLEDVSRADAAAFVDALLDEGLKAKTINSYLNAIRGFYTYMAEERGWAGEEPVRRRDYLRRERPLPRPLGEEEVDGLFEVVGSVRDRAMFLLMLRSGLRVSEVHKLDVRDIQVKEKRVFIREGKGRKDRVVCLSEDTMRALCEHMLARDAAPSEEALFVVERGRYRGLRLSVRGIQKRMESYAKKSGVKASCHRLRHTFATQALDAGMRLAFLRVLMGHDWITTTMQYCRISSVRVTQSYNRSMDAVERRVRRRRREAACLNDTG